MPKKKPVVKYGELLLLVVGSPALVANVKGHNHGLVRRGKLVQTSVVVKNLGKGSFETLNTIYKPAKGSIDRTTETVVAKLPKAVFI